MKWQKAATITGLLFVLIVAGIAFYFVFFTTPRMRIQENIRAYEALMPNAPAGSVPVEATRSLPDSLYLQHYDLVVDDTPVNSDKGKVYYGYYCLFCHGEKGDGEGPVGQSYMPMPSDLRTEKVRNLNDGELLKAMLLGTGHEPVINRVVPAEGYAPLIVYVRALAREPQPLHQ